MARPAGWRPIGSACTWKNSPRRPRLGLKNSLESACKCAVPRRPSSTMWPPARSRRPVLRPPLPTRFQAGTGHEPQHQLQRQPAAHQPCAGVAQQAGGGRDCALVWPAGRALGLHPGHQQRLLSAQGRGALCPYPGAARQPWSGARPQRPDFGLQRARAQHLGGA